MFKKLAATIGMTLIAALSSVAPGIAKEASCFGKDVIAELRQKDPKTHKAMLREERNILHGEGLLFRMEKKGHPAIHVFGTIHVDDPQFKALPQPLTAALEAADIVATELKEEDLTNPMTMLKVAALAANPKADTLTRLKPDSRSAVEKALKARGLPTGAATRMDAGFLLISLALPPCAIATDAEEYLSKEIVDQKVARAGKDFGAENIGLETAASQIQAIKGMSDASKFALLTATADADARATDMFVTMKNLYRDKKIGRLSVISYLLLPPDPAVQGAFAEFKDRLLDKRNTGMAERIEELAKDKKVVAAIGALHLIGENGVIALLEKRGYKARKLW
jgi:uncharacterized protein